jgi:ribonuclease HII
MRDEHMLKLYERFPGYGWDKNAGYGTQNHIKSIVANGQTRYHRSIFVKTALTHYAESNHPKTAEVTLNAEDRLEV